MGDGGFNWRELSADEIWSCYGFAGPVCADDCKCAVCKDKHELHLIVVAESRCGRWLQLFATEDISDRTPMGTILIAPRDGVTMTPKQRGL